MTKVRIVHRPWLARPYVVERASWIGVYVTEQGEQPQFGPFDPMATFHHEAEAREYAKRSQDERVIAEFALG